MLARLVAVVGVPDCRIFCNVVLFVSGRSMRER